MFDRSMRYLAVSRRWVRDYHLEGVDLIGRSHYDVFPEIPSRWKAAHRRALRGEVLEAQEDWFVREDGRVQWLRWELCPWRDEAGRVAGVLILSEDITGRKEGERALREGNEKMRAILDTAVDAIITIDRRGVMTSVNPAVERVFGYAPSELVGRNVSVLMPSPDRERHDGYIERYIKTGERRVIGIGREALARRKDGTTFPIELAISEIDHRSEFTGIVRDISERKAGEAKLRESDRLASIGTLAAGLGHDMNNVLLPVRARLNALRAAGEAGRLGEADRAHVEELRRSVSYLQQLADGLHFLAMDPEADGSGPGGRASTDLARWWGQVGVLLSKPVPRHVRVASLFPAGLGPVAITSHALTQAVLNLVVNAGEAIPAPGARSRRQGVVKVWARAAADGRGPWVRVGVTDNGVGMTEDVRRRAFEMFFTTKPRGLGTGLGLPLVRKVVERAGGRVEIESAPGVGTTVTLVLPRAGSRGAGRAPRAAAGSGATSERARGARRAK